MSKVDYAKIRQDNIEEYGKGTRHLSYFADIYSTRTHFIFEILQNSEDALSRRSLSKSSGFVRFHLHHDRLDIYHNGKPFDDLDIVGICGIGEGTKAADYTQIGKFGIGFKSVYAYSFFPQIHSEDEHFEIRRFVEPYEIEATLSKDTLIILPFDQPDKRPEWAFRKNVNADVAQSEISQAITKLNIRTLLFLRNIEKIEWILPNGEQGFLTKENKLENKQANWRIVDVSDHQGKHEQWQIFARNIKIKDDDKEQIATIEVAFLLENGNVFRATDTELVVSFPTEKKTELGFLIQAPFKATKSRDNIKSDDPANHQMIQTAAQLAADSLSVLRDTNCLAVASYNALPLDEDDFPDDNFFRPVYDRVREALKTQPLLPAHGGSYIKSDEAKLARGKELVGLFSSNQLGEIFGKEKIVWLDASITNDTLQKFHYYLRDLVDKIEVTPESLEPKLTADFLSNQSLEWLIQFIKYAEERTALRRVPFIRLQSGDQVALPENRNAMPTAWFVPGEAEGFDLSSFPLVHTELAANESIRAFLKKEDIREIDAVDMVVKSILPKYQETSEFNLSDYLNDLHQIAKAYSGNDEIKKKLEDQLKNVAWLACIQAGDNTAQEIVWRKPKPYSDDLFAKPEELELSFSELEGSKIYFLNPLFEKQFDDYPSFKKYLVETCIRNLGALAIVENVILPKYKIGDKTFDESEYRSDLQWILKASHVSALKQARWIACVHASGNRPDEIEWKRPNASEADRPSNRYYAISYQEKMAYEGWCNSSTLFERTPDHETWFSGLENIDAYFLHPCITETLAKDMVKNIIKPIDKLFKKSSPDYKGHINIASNHGNHMRGLNGFDPNWEIIGMDARMSSDPKMEHSVFLWNLLKLNYECIKGIIEKSSRQTFENSRAEEKTSKIGGFLSNSPWLPDKTGNLHIPGELLLTDLPDEFETISVSAREVAEKLGMKKPEAEQAINILVGSDPNKISQLERFLSASDAEREKMLKIIPEEIPSQPAPSFREGLGNLFRPQHGITSANSTDNPSYPMSDPERYQNNVNQHIEEKVRQHETTPQTIRFSIVRESSSNQEARHFLYQQYQGKCQITGNTFPKATANSNGDAVNYFEVCSLLSYNNADYLNNAGNMLCVSADTMAKLKNASFEWLDDLVAIIENFNNRQQAEIENVKAKVILAGEECEIIWSERHFALLVALWEKA